MKKIFNSYLELGALNQFLLFISFIILNILLTKLFIFIGIEINDSNIYKILRPAIGLLTITSLLLIFKKTPRAIKKGKEIEGAPKLMYALVALIMLPTGSLMIYFCVSSFYKMSQSDWDFSRTVYGVSGETAHTILLLLLLIGSISMVVAAINHVIAIIKNKKIKD
tara:strand:+ start:532 stop:1029 length:498 start_codon:yes stop_codon:yes gene_type:complete